MQQVEILARGKSSHPKIAVVPIFGVPRSHVTGRAPTTALKFHAPGNLCAPPGNGGALPGNGHQRPRDDGHDEFRIEAGRHLSPKSGRSHELYVYTDSLVGEDLPPCSIPPGGGSQLVAIPQRCTEALQETEPSRPGGRRAGANHVHKPQASWWMRPARCGEGRLETGGKAREPRGGVEQPAQLVSLMAKSRPGRGAGSRAVASGPCDSPSPKSELGPLSEVGLHGRPGGCA